LRSNAMDRGLVHVSTLPAPQRLFGDGSTDERNNDGRCQEGSSQSGRIVFVDGNG
jgi:hypothetical protein